MFLMLINRNTPFNVSENGSLQSDLNIKYKTDDGDWNSERKKRALKEEISVSLPSRLCQTESCDVFS